MQYVSNNKSLKLLQNLEATEFLLNVVDIFPILPRFSAASSIRDSITFRVVHGGLIEHKLTETEKSNSQFFKTS